MPRHYMKTEVLKGKVLTLMGRGLTSKQIAYELGKGISTIDRVKQEIKENTKIARCTRCGRPFTIESVGTTVPCENESPPARAFSFVDQQRLLTLLEAKEPPAWFLEAIRRELMWQDSGDPIDPIAQRLWCVITQQTQE